MKKIYYGLISGACIIRKSKLLKRMKIVALLILITITQTFALGSYAQNKRLSLSAKDEKIINILDEIEKQSDFYFMFDASKIDVSQRKSIDCENRTITSILDQLFEDTGITYRISDRQIGLISTKFVDADQSLTVSGKVTDSSGVPLPGLTVVIKETTNGTITDAEGNYSLAKVPGDAILVFSFVGMKTQEISVEGKSMIDVVMQEETIGLEEVVAVGYGAQSRSTLTGSVDNVKSDKLTVTPVGNITNALTGKLSGLITTQTQGLPGSDQADLSIRGFGTPLVIVDGIEAKLTNLDPNQIESISILKDGASSIYGARAGNGVILITTKRGVNQKPTISLNTSYTLQGVTNMAKTLSSGQYTELARESHLNAGYLEETAPYSAEEVAKYYAGDDPAYPSSDWYHFTFRDWAPQQNHNVSIRGGSEKIKYMGFFGYQKQETMIKKNGGKYQRFNVSSNIDAEITKNLSLSIDLMAAYERSKFSGRGLGNNDGAAWQDLYLTRPWFPTTLPDPTKNASGGIDVGSVALSTNMDIWGYNKSEPTDLRGAITLTYDVPFIEGLKAKGFVNYMNLQTMGKWFQKPYQWYTYNYGTDLYTFAGSLWTAAQSTESINRSSQITQQYSLNYNRKFKAHNLSVLALFESIDNAANNFWASRRNFLTPLIEQLFAGSADTQTNSGSASESGRGSLVGRINYSYKERYLLEMILRTDASSKFIKGKRWGYFPGISLGWVISKEKFMQKLTALEFLKLRASYGESGYDNVGSFKYITGYQINGVYQWDNSFTSGLISTGLANPNLTWEVMEIYNGGLDFSILNRTLYGSIDAFYRTRTGIPGTRVNSYPSTFGASLPTENLNSQNNRGFELQLGTMKRRGNFYYDISANISWSRAKWNHYDEADFDDPDQKRQQQLSDQWTDRAFGYVSDGLFKSMEEINSLQYNYAELGGGNTSLRPGDIKYKDTNDDGVLDWRDKVEIGKGNTPHWFYGLNGSFMYKGFDLVAMFQGAFGYSSSTRHVYNTEYTFKERWTEANNNSNALIPRPGGASSNDWISDYWIKSVRYLRLKNIALGYTLPKQWANKAGFEKVHLSVSGTNLFTLSTLGKYYIDPEAPSGTVDRYYPQQRTISLGLNLDF